MDTKANLSNRKKINELAAQHNKLTTLVACLLNEVSSLKKELSELKGSDVSSSSKQLSHDNYHNNGGRGQMNNNNNNNKYTNFNELRAEDILKQLSINNSDN